MMRYIFYVHEEEQPPVLEVRGALSVKHSFQTQILDITGKDKFHILGYFFVTFLIVQITIFD